MSGPERPIAPPDAPPREPGAGEPDLLVRLRGIARENERLFDELLAAERRYRGLARSVWNVQEEERRRLARELHDGIGQTLTALKNHLERVAGKAREAEPRLAEDLAAAAEMAGAAVHDTRELSRLLRPPVLDDLGLVPALSWLTRTIERRTGLAIDLEVAGDLGTPDRDGPDADGERLEPGIETVVFRVVQEALTNVLKHSGARRAGVAVASDASAVRVRITDRGSGFDADATLDAASTSGVGLSGMRDRVELFGGRLTLVSSPGQGTEIRLTIPRVATAGPDGTRGGER